MTDSTSDGWRRRRAARAALGLALVWIAGAAFAGEPMPDVPFDIPQGAYQASFVDDVNHITVMEFVGDYGRELPDGTPNLPARAVVAQEFYRTHPDEYDFLVSFTTFEFETGEALAFYQAARNDVEGIGLPLFDNSQLYGSDGRLRGYVEMAATGRYELNPFAPDYEFVLTTLAHEVLHQWGAFVRYRDAGGEVSDRLLGRNLAHWNFLLETQASVEYGHRWRDNGDGTFTAVDARRFYSPLDLYLMGLLAPEEVPDFIVIDSADADPSDLPLKGTTVSGAADLVGIDDIIDVEGPRIPDAATSPKDFRFAFILLTPPGEEASPETLALLDAVRRDFATRFAIMTGGRARAHIFPQALPVEEIGQLEFVTGGPLRDTGASVEDGLAWLRATQAADGSWADKPGTSVRDTAEVFRVFSDLDPLSPQLLDARGFLLAQTDLDTDSLARLILALGELAGAERIAELAGRQNADGGWGLNPGDRSDALDTALAVLALDPLDAAPQGVSRGLDFLVAKQNADGGWPAGEQGPSNVLATSHVLLALGELGAEGAALEDGVQFLIAGQGLDGGFGTEGSSVHETALAIATLIALNRTDSIDLGAARDYIDSRQSEEGSWSGSSYTTALALFALQSLDFPNWKIESLVAELPVLLDGERTPIEIRVRNDGREALPAGSLRLYDGDPAAAAPVLDTLLLPPLQPQQAVALEFVYDSFDQPGLHTITALVDPDGLVEERSEGDNQRSVAIQVDPAPSGVDFELSAADLAIVPENPFTLPSGLGISANVRNLGDTSATAVGIQLWRGPPDDEESELLQETSVDVLSRSNTLVNFSHELTRAGTTFFFVVVDPADAVAELREDNNQASASVTTTDSVDLEIAAAEIVFDPKPGLLGQDIVFQVPVRNRGTTTAPPTQVRYAVSGTDFHQDLQVVDVSLEAGETVLHTVAWRVDRLGDFTFTAEIDFADVIPELSEANNQAALPFTTQVEAGANLRVDFRDLSFSPTPALEGGDVTLNGVVINSGTLDLTDVEVAFYDGNPAQGGVEVGVRTVLASLPAGTAAAVSSVWLGVPGTADRVIHIVADPDDEIAEFDESDNRAFASLEVLALPDLAISPASIQPSPSFPREGDPIALAVVVSNLGAQPAAAVLVRAYAGDPDAGGVLIGSDIIATIAAFATGTASFVHTIPSGEESQQIHVLVDPDAAIAEGDEGNNRARRSVAVQTGNTFVTQPFISPNGDDVQEETEFFFALDGAQQIDVVVVNDRDEVVRRAPDDLFAGSVTEGQFVWDGRDDDGRVVPDGIYRFQARTALDQPAAEGAVVVDTDRSPLLNAVGTPFAAFTDLTKTIGQIQEDYPSEERMLIVAPDDEFIYFQASGYGEVPLEPGVYRVRLDGSGLTQLGAEYWILALSPDGKTLVMGGSGCAHFALDTETGDLRQLDGLDQCFDFTQFADSDTLLFANGYRDSDEKEFFTYSIAAGTPPTPLVTLPPTQVWSIIGIETRPGFALVRSTHTRYDPPWTNRANLIDLATGDVTLLGSDAAFSPDGALIAAVDVATTTVAVQTLDGTVLQTLDFPSGAEGGAFGPWLGGYAQGTSWSDDQRLLAFQLYGFPPGACPGDIPTNTGGLFVVDLETGEFSQKTIVSKEIECVTGGGGSFHVAVERDGQFEERDALHFGLPYSYGYMPIEPADIGDGTLTLRITQIHHEEAEIDELVLVDAHGRRFEPAAARNVTRDQDVREAILEADRHVAPAHEQVFEFTWTDLDPAGDLLLAMSAREATLSHRRILPFSYPAPNRGFPFELDGSGALVVDGQQTDADGLLAPIFSAVTHPDTGHPVAPVLGYLKNDQQYLYAALDFGVDNSPEGVNDWASISVRGDRDADWQTFRIAGDVSPYGRVGFGRSAAVGHPHKYYEFQVALADLGFEPGEQVEVRFNAYGSAGIIFPEQDLQQFAAFSLVGGLPQTSFFDYEWPLDGGDRPTMLEPGDISFTPAAHELVFTAPILLEGGERDGWAVAATRIRLEGEPAYDAIFPERIPMWLSLTPNGRALTYWSRLVDGFLNYDYHLSTFRSLLNLTADLRALRSASEAGILLEGTASDANFAEYSLEYRSAAQGSPWQPLAPASDVPVVDGRFTTWVPPAPGSYFVRLSVRDKAGNTRAAVQRVSWSDRTPITGLQTDNPQISPNGDGVLDGVALSFVVREPVHVELEVLDEQGNLVRSFVESFEQVGEQEQLFWDGRDDSGFTVPDGDYTLLIGRFRFFVSVDNTAPAVLDLTPELAFFYTWSHEECDLDEDNTCFVGMRPRYEVEVADLNLDEIVIESKPRDAGLWEVDASAEVKEWPQPGGERLLWITPRLGVDSTDPLDPQTALGEQLRKLTERDYRLRAVDFADNEAVLPLSAVPKRDSVIVLFNGNHQQEEDADLTTELAGFTTAKIRSASGFPARRARELRFSVAETVAEEIQSVFVDFRTTGTDTWESVEATQFVGIARTVDAGLVAALLDVRNDHYFHLLFDPRTLGGGPLEFRVRLLDVAGQEHVSNAFSFVFTQGVALEVNEGLDYIREDLTPVSLTFDLNFEIAEIALSVSSEGERVDPAFTPRRVVQKVTPEDESALLDGLGAIDFEPLPLRACKQYEFEAVVYGANGEQASALAAIDFPCFGVRVQKVEPVHAAACGDPPTNEIRVELGVFNDNLEDFELTQLTVGVDSGVGEPDIIFNVVKPAAGSSKHPELQEFILDTTPFADGEEVKLVVEVTNEVGRTVTRRTSVPIDHQPPVLEIVSPLEGQHVCAEQLLRIGEDGSEIPLRGVEIQALVTDAHEGSAYTPQASFIERWRGSTWLDEEPLDLLREESRQALYRASRRRTLQGNLSASGLQDVVLTEVSGEHSVTLELVDFGTFRACTERSFEVDASVDGAAAALTSSPYLSPDGDGVSDELELSFFTGEAVELTLEVYRALPLAPGAGTSAVVVKNPQGERFEKTDELVATVADGLPALPGETLLAWDGFVVDGDYAVELNARDACQNAYRRHFYARVDTTPPTAEILAPLPADPIAVVNEVFGTVEDEALEVYRLELASALAPDAFQVLATGTQNVSADVLGVWNTHGLAGSFILQLVARDRAGNESVTSLEYALAERSDLLKDFELLGRFVSPNGDGRREELPIRFTAGSDLLVTLEILNEQGSLVRTLASGAPYAPGSAMLAWDARDDAGAVVTDGRYAVRITAALAANPLLTQTASLSATVDSLLPSVEVEGIVEGFLQPPHEALVSVADVHLERYEVSLAVGAGSESFTTLIEGTRDVTQLPVSLGSAEAFPDGEYVLRVFASDLGESQTDLRLPFVIDREPPVVVLEEPDDDAAFPADATPHLATGVVEEPNLAGYELVLRSQGGAEQVLGASDQLPVTSELASFSLAGQVDGLYTLVLRASDRGGNQASDGHLLVIDSEPPTVAITKPVSGGFVGRNAEIRGVVSDANPEDYELLFSPAALDDVAAATSLAIGRGQRDGLLYTWRVLPEDGDYRLYLLARDRAENESVVSTLATVDGTPPSAPEITDASFDADRNVSLTWAPSPEPDVAGYHVSRDGARVTAEPIAETSFVDAAVAEGDHRYQVLAVDRAGNESALSAARELRVDTTPPEVGITSPGPGALVGGLVDVRGTASSPDDFQSYRVLVGGGATPGSFDPIGAGTLPRVNTTLAQWSTLDASDGVFTIRLEAEDLSGNVGSAEVQVTVDNTPPAAPTNLQAVATGSDVSLTWNANAEPDLAGYLLFRNGRLVNVEGVLVGSLLPYALPDNFYDDLALADGVFTYLVFAIDAAGNTSEPSEPAEATIDQRPPHVELTRPQAGDPFDFELTLAAQSADQDIAEVVFELRAAGGVDPWTELGRDASEPYMLVADTQSLDFGDYEVRGVASDLTGNVDPAPTVVPVTHRDLDPPDPVTDLAAFSDGDTVLVTWTAPAESDLASYEILRIPWLLNAGFNPNNGVLLDTSADPLATSFADEGVADGRYIYRVTAVDTADNLSEPTFSEEVPVFAPQAPVPVNPTAQTELDVEVTSAYAGEIEAQLDNASGTTVFPLQPIAAGEPTTLAAGPLELGENTLTLRILEERGHRSRPVSFVLVRGEAPSAPTGLVTSVSGFDVSASWNPNPESDILGYRLFRDGEDLTGQQEVSFSSTNISSVTIDGYLTSCQNFSSYQAVNQDFEFQLSQPQVVSTFRFHQGTSNWFTPKDFDLYAWSGHAWVRVAAVRDAKPYRYREHRFDVDFAPYVTDRFRMDVLTTTSSYYTSWNAPYAFRVCEVSAFADELITGTSALDPGVPDGFHDYTVTAVNEQGLESDPSEPSVAAVGDVTPPDPVTLTGSVNGSTVTLSWSESASDDVVSYEIFRDGALLATLADDGGASFGFADTGLKNGAYSYTVRAVDDMGLVSADSNAFVATVAVPPPPAPENLEAIPEATGAAVALSWTVAAGSTPAGFAVYRAEEGGPFELVAIVTGTSFVDREVVAGRRYTYLVRALDPYENESPDSNLVEVETVDLVPPDAPAIADPTRPGSSHYTARESVRVAGEAEPGSEVFLFRNGEIFDSMPASTEVVATVIETPSSISDYRDYDLPRTYGNWTALRGAGEFGFLIIDASNGETIADIWGDILETFAFDERGQRMFQVYYGTPELAVLDLAEGVSTWIDLGVVPSEIRNLYLAPSGTQLVIEMDAGVESGLYIHDLPTGTTELVVPLAPFEVYERTLALSPDGRYLSYATYDGRQVLDLETGESFSLTGVISSSAPDADWSPDSTRLVYRVLDSSYEEADIYLFDVRTGTESVLVEGQDRYVSPTWSLDGSAVAYVSDSPEGHQIRLRHLDAGTDEVVFQSDYVVSILWSRTNHLRSLVQGGDLVVLEMPGSFAFEDVPLEAGENRFAAAALDASGNEGAPCEEIEVIRIAGPDPDLVASVAVVPAVPFAGNAAEIELTVSNRGGGDAEDASVDLVATDPGGQSLTLVAGQRLGPIASGGQQTLVVPWLPRVEGDHTLVAIVDRDDEIPEGDDVNNVATLLVPVSPDAAPTVEVAAFPAAVGSESDLGLELQIRNAGRRFVGSLEVRIEDPAQAAVALVDRIPVDLVAGGSFGLTTAWNTARIFAGPYRAVAVLLDRFGSPVALAETGFEIVPDERVVLDLLTDRAEYGDHEPVRILASVQRMAGNTLFDDAVASLRVLRGDELIFGDASPVGMLLPGDQVDVGFVWNTGSAFSDTYVVSVEITKQDQLLAQASVPVQVVMSATRIEGTLVLANGAVPLGDAIEATYSVVDEGNIPLPGTVVTVALRDGQTLAELLSQPFTHDLAVGVPVTQTLTFATGGLPIGSYQIELRSESPYQGDVLRQSLDHELAAVIDIVPPVVAILQPDEGAIVNGRRTSLQVDARDLESAVARVEAGTDGGPFVPIALGASGAYELGLRALEEGGHGVAIRAFDLSGNAAPLVSRSFTIDNTPPEVTISGVTEGLISPDPVTPVIEVSDDNLVSQTIQLDGVDFVSGTSVEADGDYLLNVVATDAAGNVTGRLLAFAIDGTPPEAPVITSHSDGEIVETAIVTLEGQAEAGTRVVLTLNGGSFGEAIAAADGRFEIAGVPLEEGDNLLRFVAIDAAGNSSPETLLTLVIEPEIQGSVLGGHTSWMPIEESTVEISVRNAFRRDAYTECVDLETSSFVVCSGADALPAAGDVIAETVGLMRLDFGDGSEPAGSPLELGDGSPGPLLFLVTSIDPDENALFGAALDEAALPEIATAIRHSYPAPGVYLVAPIGGERLSGPAGEAFDGVHDHLNNPDLGWRLETLVNAGGVDASPVSGMPAIVRCPIAGVCSFPIPAADPEGEPLAFRLATGSEADTDGGFVQPGPPLAPNAASVDVATGEFTWDTTAATLSGEPGARSLYSAQVVVEDSVNRVAVEFLIELVPEDPAPPSLVAATESGEDVCGATLELPASDTLVLHLDAFDADPEDVVVLSSAGLPLGSSVAPELPQAGNPATAAFSWTPAETVRGTTVLSFSARSSSQGFAFCPVTVKVVEPGEQCVARDDYAPGTCRGTFPVFSLEDLEEYVATQYGREGDDYKHLRINRDLEAPVLDIESPCSISLANDIVLRGDFVSLDGRLGVRDVNGYQIHAHTACVVSAQGNAEMGKETLVEAVELRVQGHNLASIGRRSQISVERDLEVVSTGTTFESSALIDDETVVSARSLTLEANGAVELGSQTQVEATGAVTLRSTGDASESAARIGGEAAVLASDLSVSAARQAEIADSAIVDVSGNVSVLATDPDAEAALRRAAAVTAGGDMLLSSGGQATVEEESSISVGGALTIEAGSWAQCAIDPGATLEAPSMLGNCLD